MNTPTDEDKAKAREIMQGFVLDRGHAHSMRDVLYERIAQALADERCAPPGHIIDCTGPVPVVRKVLGTLPVTADGCVCNPSEDVFHHGSNRVGVPVWSDDADKWLGEFDHSGAGEWFYPPLAECYSTREAAESARKEPHAK